MTLEKYINSFHWYDSSNEELVKQFIFSPKEKLDYPVLYHSLFGTLPVNYLRLSNKLLPTKNLKKFEKCLLSMGLRIYERGHNQYKYICEHKKIVISGETVSMEELSKCDDFEDEDDIDIPSLSDDEVVYISILPSVENKIFITKLLRKVVKYFVDATQEENKFYMVAQNSRGLYSQRTKFKSIPIPEERYDLFYGESFPHEKLKAFINNNTENLMLLHGDPGTGKSNYIKHIITNSKKKVIYIPPSMLSVISSPGFISYMMENKNSIIIIEDAEEVLSVDRNAATNNLLGLTDGFLKDSLNLKILCTFNCNVGKIDPALMRKGRLYFEYKFKKLEVDECKKLADFLGKTKTITESMSLAEFFNEEENRDEDFNTERCIGFLS